MKRNISLDLIRIFAIFLVLYTHTGTIGNKIYTVYPRGLISYLNLSTDCFRTINNHLLFMISGALLLGKQESIKVLWKKRILRFVIVLFIFSYVQAIWNAFRSDQFQNFSVINTFIQMLEKPIRSQYWYLYSYISFLVMLPFLRFIAKALNDKVFVYLLIISIIVQDIFPLLSVVLNISRINFSIFITPFASLSPLLGYYLVHNNGGIFRKFKTSLLLFLIALSLNAASLMTVRNQIITGKWEEKYITLFYTLTAICVFELFMRLLKMYSFHPKIIKMIVFISEGMFGIYLLENILEYYTRPIYEFLSKGIPVWGACVIWLISTMFIGSVVIRVFKFIPGVRSLL